MPESEAMPSQRGIEGPPDLVIEILSPSNRAHDQQTKRRFHERGGVREYWLVDPSARTIEVLRLEAGRYRSLSVLSGDDAVASPLLANGFPAGEAIVGLDELSA